ncbi:MAG: RraA family protein [Spirosomaceae bacterium]|jgi:regulator of RNase E activity RraA|nr:RraA family protein [Spirosomataceae bacterium]
MKNLILSLFLFSLFLSPSFAQIKPSKELIMFYTQEWKGERFPDGRPKVPDELVKRLANVSIEEAWGIMRGEGYNNQFEGNFQIIHPEKPLVGRVLTAQYMPARPDMEKPIKAKGKEEGRKGNTNSWPIDELQINDVYVADGFGKIVDGTLIGDNLGNSIYAKSKTGVVFDGSVRDLEGLSAIDGFVSFTRGYDPSAIKDMTMTCINCPIRIGRASVLPGDLVLGKPEGVIFIPAHLADKVINTSEFIALQDEFGHKMLREGKFTPGEIDMKWSEAIKTAFREHVKTRQKKTYLTAEQIEKYLEKE